MEIIKQLEDTALTLQLSGRLDTVTAPDLESVINSELGNITKLTFDFANLEYISSAGLRVLLASQKKMAKQGEMSLRNVSDEIKEIFDITGFSDILTVE